MIMPVAVIALIWSAYSMIHISNQMQRPEFSQTDASFVKAANAVKSVTPGDAVIWTDWGFGYPLIYYSDRATVADGSISSNMQYYITMVPVATNNERLSANWIRFYIGRGIKGFQKVFDLFGQDWGRSINVLKEILSTGPSDAAKILKNNIKTEDNSMEDLIEFFFPRSIPPTYLFLNTDMFRTNWYGIGNWDFEQKIPGENILNIFTNLHKNGNMINGKSIRGYGDMEFDMDHGIMSFRKKQLNISSISYNSEGNISEFPYPWEMGLRLEVMPAAGFGVLMEKKTAESVFNRFFVRFDHDEQYFSLIINESPNYQLWEVKGDSPETCK